jgi:hypothetical protein
MSLEALCEKKSETGHDELTRSQFKTAATMTMNSPESLLELHRLATSGAKEQSVYAAELMREVGLKCIGFNGVRSFTRIHKPQSRKCIRRSSKLTVTGPPNNQLPRGLLRRPPQRHPQWPFQTADPVTSHLISSLLSPTSPD